MRSVAELTPGERAADWLRNRMGSWGFVFWALVFLAGWMAGAIRLIAAQSTNRMASDPPTASRST